MVTLATLCFTTSAIIVIGLVLQQTGVEIKLNNPLPRLKKRMSEMRRIINKYNKEAQQLEQQSAALQKKIKSLRKLREEGFLAETNEKIDKSIAHMEDLQTKLNTQQAETKAKYEILDACEIIADATKTLKASKEAVEIVDMDLIKLSASNRIRYKLLTGRKGLL